MHNVLHIMHKIRGLNDPPTIHCFDGMGTSNASIPKVPLSLAVDGTKTYRSCPIISLQVATTITKSPLKEKQEHS